MELFDPAPGYAAAPSLPLWYSCPRVAAWQLQKLRSLQRISILGDFGAEPDFMVARVEVRFCFGILVIGTDAGRRGTGSVNVQPPPNLNHNL